MKVRFAGRKYKWAEHREDLFSPGATQSAGRVKDFLPLKMGLETFAADVVDAYCQAPEYEKVVEPAPKYLERLVIAGRDTDIVWRLRRQLPGRRAASQSWADHLAGKLVNKLIFRAVQDSPTVLLERSVTCCIGLHIDDISHGAATRLDANNSSMICHMHVRLNSKDVTDASWKNRMNTSRDFGYQNIWTLLHTN